MSSFEIAIWVTWNSLPILPSIFGLSSQNIMIPHYPCYSVPKNVAPSSPKKRCPCHSKQRSKVPTSWVNPDKSYYKTVVDSSASFLGDKVPLKKSCGGHKLKSDNIQYNKLGRWIDGTIISFTKCLMFQVLLFS